MKIKFLICYIMLAILFVLFNVCAFVIPTEKTATFWVAYVFGCISFIAQVFVIAVTFGKDKLLKSKFLGFPLLYVGAAYLFLQLIVFAVFMAIPSAPVWICILICALLLGFAAIFLIFTKASVTEIERIDKKVNSKVSFIKNLQAEVEILAQTESNAEIKTALNKLASDIKFSDPISDDSLHDLEQKIKQGINELNTSPDKIKAIKQIELVLLERNKKCKLLK